MRLITFPSVASLALPDFYTPFHQQYKFRGEKIIEYNMHVSIFSTNFDWNISQFKKDLVKLKYQTDIVAAYIYRLP
jgi:hypothetical protein